jgi:hypothetical protein
MAIVGLAVVVLVAVSWWALPRVRASTRSDLMFLIGRLALVFALGMFLLLADVLYGRYCVFEHGVEYCRVRGGDEFLALFISEPSVLVGGSAITLYRWGRRIAVREGAGA